MKRPRTLVSSSLQAFGIALLLAMGVAIGAQDQDDPNPAPKKSTTKAAPKAATDTANSNDSDSNKAPPKTTGDAAPDKSTPRTNRTQPNGPRSEKPATEEQRAAALGAQFEAKGDQGFQVKTVEPNGIFGHAGLRQSDRIVSAEGYTFNSPRQFEAWLWSQPGRQIPVIIDRGGKQYTIQISMPQQGANSGWLGVNLGEGDADQQGKADVKGAKVTQVYPSGPASRAGLQPGDIITQINGSPVEGSADAVMLIRELQPQSNAELAVLRGSEEMKISVMVGDRARSGYQSFYRGQQNNFQQGQQGNPGDRRYAGNEQGQGNQVDNHNQFHGIPPHAMQLEHDRRTAEQHERIEDEIRQLREEIKQLRELLEKK